MVKKILVVEDDEDVAMLVATVIRKAGYDVVTAQDCIAALSVAQQDTPDLITLDIGVPGGGGVGFLESLRGDTLTSRVPVIVITGSGLIERDEVIAQGAQAYLHKPFETAELIDAVRGLIGS